VASVGGPASIVTESSSILLFTAVIQGEMSIILNGNNLHDY